jgi:hypothetical protein
MNTNTIFKKAIRVLKLCGVTVLAGSFVSCVRISIVEQGCCGNSSSTGGGRAIGGSTTTTTLSPGTTLNPVVYSPAPGGDFIPVPNQPVWPAGNSLICNTPVSGSYARFWTTQTPDATKVAFQGYVRDDTSGLVIANVGYKLQWVDSGGSTDCCTNVPNLNFVGCPVVYGRSYIFAAHFKTGYVPTSGHVVGLYGSFIQTPD